MKFVVGAIKRRTMHMLLLARFCSNGSKQHFPVIDSHIDVSSCHFVESEARTLSLIDDLRAKLSTVGQGGGEISRKKHMSRGKLLVRDRVAKLLDEGSSFLELSPLSGLELYSNENIPAAGIVTGIGQVHGKHVMVIANDATVKGGCYFPITVKKHLRAQEVAEENMLPCVYLVDSGGGYLPMQAGAFADRDHFGRIFFNQARMSARGIPQVSVVMGSCTAGGAYVPAMSDENSIVEGNGTIFLAGPPLVRAATYEVVSAEALGGARMHCSQSGVADQLARDDCHALLLARAALEPQQDLQQTQAYPRDTSKADWQEPQYPPHELNGLAPGAGAAVDVHAVVARLVDGSRFQEFKPRFGRETVTGWACIHGHQVGIVGERGARDIIGGREREGGEKGAGALKAAHFVQLCNRRHVPLLFLQNNTGIPGSGSGSGSIDGGMQCRHTAKLMQSVATASVPKLTCVLGGSFGLSSVALCGRSFGPRLLFLWPSARVATMPEQFSDGWLRSNNAQKDQGQLTEESSAVYSSSRLWDDGVIEPEDTRCVLGQCLEVIVSSMGTVDPSPMECGVFRM